MTWIFFALLGYFFNAFTQLLDKFILSGNRIPEPAVYAFYVALFSLFSFFFTPFGFAWIGIPFVAVFLLSGMLFLYGTLAFYYAVKAHEVSRIAPLVGLVTSVTVIAIGSAFPQTFGEMPFSAQTLAALALFILGGALISYDLPFRSGDRLPYTVLLSGALLGVSLLILKYGYTQADFINGLVWSRIGIFLAGLTLLLVPLYRKKILVKRGARPLRNGRSLLTAFLFVLNKSTAGTASFLILYATALGSVSFVQALNGMQYVFLLFLSLPMSLLFPEIFKEKLSFWDWFQKAVALCLITAGFFVAGIHGLALL